MDDAFAELDEERARALWSLVSERHQIFLAVPRWSDVEQGGDGALFEVEAGRLRRAR
jgi:recombinational DNA repair ATPase RecF